MTHLGSNPQLDLPLNKPATRLLQTFRRELGKTEWAVVDMARHDGARSLNPNGLAARLLRVFGIVTKGALANVQLEALRRFSVRAWCWDVIRVKDLRALSEAGFTWDDALCILAHVAEQRGFTPSIEAADLTEPRVAQTGALTAQR